MGLRRREFLQVSAAGAAGVWFTTPVRAASPNQDHGGDAPVPDWVHDVTRMAFVTSGDIPAAADAGVQVIHTNLIWPYYPLRRDGGGLSREEDSSLRELVEACHSRGMRISLGLPPFPHVDLVNAHPDWRIHPDRTGSVLQLEPRDDNLGTRIGCNLGPWGEYLIEVCAELVRDYGIDGYSFDGNYHPPICYCPACERTYHEEQGRELPPAANLDDLAYREYFEWRGRKLVDHYRSLRRRIQQENPEAVIISWTVNAGRYGHLLHSPRAMPIELNRVFDMPMQEWWLDETNLGASIAPVFGAAYLKAVAGDRPAASEAYLMSRGNPYGTDSFPAHERLTRTLLALTNGCIAAESFGWSGHRESTAMVLDEVARRAEWMSHLTPIPWCGMLVSEQTRQFYAYRNITEHFLPHVFGGFRCLAEEHVPFTLLTDDDVTPESLARHAVVLLPNAAALSESQLGALREYVLAGGGLVVIGESSLCDQFGRPRGDFALADLLGVSYRGRPQAPLVRPELDVNFQVAIDENYWQQRTGIARLIWENPPFLDDSLRRLVPHGSVTFKGTLVAVSEPEDLSTVWARMQPDGTSDLLPAVVARQAGRGRVVYLAAALDAALWSYAYPYQRRLLRRCLDWAAHSPLPVEVDAPLCVLVRSYIQSEAHRDRLLIHLFNNINTSADRGLPANEVPLREETIPIHGIQVHLGESRWKRFRLQPQDLPVDSQTDEAGRFSFTVPQLDLHAILVAES